MRVLARTLAVWILTSQGVVAQEFPKWTPQRQKLVGELLVGCVGEGGLTLTDLPGSKGKFFRVVDRDKLRATLASRRKRLGPEMRDGLAALWGHVNEASWPAVVVLLELAGRETRDEQALGLAAYLSALAAQHGLRLAEADKAYRNAISHFEEAKQTGFIALCLNDLGFVLQAQGRRGATLTCHKQALTMYRKLYPPTRFPDGHPHLATSLANIGLALDEQGSYEEALAYFQQALVIFRKLYPATRYPDGHSHLVQMLNNLGGALEDQGLHEEARRSFNHALTMSRKLYPPSRYPDGHPDLAAALNNLGLVLQAQGAYGEALSHYKQALAMRRRLYPPERYPNGHPNLARSLNNLGFLLEAQGSYKEALGYFDRALAMFRKLYPPDRYPNGHPDLAFSLNNRGAVLLAQGSYTEATDVYSEALQHSRTARQRIDPDGGPEVARSLEPAPITAKSLSSRAWVLTRMAEGRPSAGQLRRAERAWALAAALTDRLRSEALRKESDKLQHGEDADRQLPFHVDLLARLFQSEGKGQDLEKAFAVIEEGRARIFLESLGQAHAAALAGLPAKLAAEERRLSLTLRERDARIQRLSLQPGDEPARQVRQLYADRLKLEEQEKAFLDKLRQSHPQYAGFRHPQPCSVEEARSCLHDNEVALLFAVGKEFSYALLLGKTARPGDPGQGIALFRLPGGKELNPLLGTLLTPDTLQHPARARELAGALFRKLLGPLHERLKGKDLLVVPDGALALLPFEMLVEGQTEEDGHWLIEQHGVRYAPSLTALHLSRQVKRQKPTQPLWALADPIFDDKDTRLKGQPPGPSPDPTLLAARQGMTRLRGGAFGRLVHSGREVESICQALGVPVEKTVRGLKASEAAVKAARDEMAQARFVHFATHGIVSERSAYATALVLNQVGNDGKEELGGVNDGFLRLPEVAFLKLNADVVVLSACATARGRRSGGEGISGVARTFLYAGSKGVVCSLWSVDDARTADLMADFYKNLKAGKDTPDALRQAQRAMLHKGLPPFFWASFVLMGQ